MNRHLYTPMMALAFNAGRFVEFLKDFRKGGRGRVFLVVDGHPSHHANLVKEYVEATRAWSCTLSRPTRRTSIRTSSYGSTRRQTGCRKSRSRKTNPSRKGSRLTWRASKHTQN